MSGTLMTSAEMDAYERRWKWLLFASATTLVLDLVYLYAISQPSLARFACVLLALASGCVCAIALRRLHSIGNMEATVPTDLGDVVDVVDALTDLCNPD